MAATSPAMTRLTSEAAHPKAKRFVRWRASRAVDRLASFTPPWPLPKLFRLTRNGRLPMEDLFEGSTINTPSMLCLEDYLSALAFIDRRGRPEGPSPAPTAAPKSSPLGARARRGSISSRARRDCAPVPRPASKSSIQMCWRCRRACVPTCRGASRRSRCRECRRTSRPTACASRPAHLDRRPRWSRAMSKR